MRLTNLVNRLHVTGRHTYKERAISYNIIHGNYSIIWPNVCPESCLQLHIQYYASHISSNSLRWSIESAEYFLCHTIPGPKSSFISETTIRPLTLHRFPIHLDNKYEFSGGKRPITVFHRPGLVPTTHSAL